MRNETASNHYKQTQMGVLGDGSESGKTREINKFYFNMHNGLMGHRPLEKLWLANTELAEVIVQLKIELVGGSYNINTLDLRYVEN